MKWKKTPLLIASIILCQILASMMISNTIIGQKKISENMPISSVSSQISSVLDNYNNVWNYTTPFYIKSGQNLLLYSNWTSVMYNGSVIVSNQPNGTQIIVPVIPTSNNSSWLNFSITIPNTSAFNGQLLYFQISGYINPTTKTNSSWQPYNIFTPSTPQITEFEMAINNTYSYTWTGNTTSYELDNIQSSVAPAGTFSIIVFTDLRCSSVNIQLQDEDPLKVYTVSLSNPTDDGTTWDGTLNLNQPESMITNPIFIGRYDLQISITDIVGVQNTTMFTKVLSISFPTPLGLDYGALFMANLWWILIIIGVAVVGVVIILRMRKVKAKSTQSDFEISKGPSKGKRGKVYSGASAIGKASGNQAEMLQQRRSEKIGGTTVPAPKPSSVQPAISSSSNPTKIATNKSISEPSVQPKGMKQIDTEKEIDDLLKDKSGVSSAVKLKQAEASLDVKRRMDFLGSKLSALDQQFPLIYIILDQTGKMEVSTQTCSNCGHALDPSWNQCPYCLTNQNEELIQSKSSSLTPIGLDMMCPVCKKILKAEWTRCPYCYARDHGM
jgi:RNA polymerase subunit RPABC4/transcription elongation factor Spt4